MPIRSVAQQRAYRKYNTQEVIEKLKKEQPAYADNLLKMEEVINSIKLDDSTKIFQIPMVFHIMESGTTKNFPNAKQIKEQLDLLNTAFGQSKKKFTEYPNDKAEKFSSEGANVGISFCLPEKIGTVAGINIIKTDVKTWTLSQDVKDPKKGGFSPIDPNVIKLRNLNLYFINN